MNSYKVIKSFAAARKGDMLEPNEKGLLVLNVQDKFSSRFVAVDEDTANELVEKGYLLEMKSSNNDTRLEAIKDFCDTMLQKYDSDLDEVLSKYNEGLSLLVLKQKQRLFIII